MNSHPHLRAYMAGITVPTVLLLGAMTIFIVARHVYDVPDPIERIVVFPMALVPNLWGVWNKGHAAMGPRRWPLGVHGAILPLLLIPAGWMLARLLDIEFITVRLALLAAPLAMIVYYLAWKYLVGYLNRVVGVNP